MIRRINKLIFRLIAISLLCALVVAGVVFLLFAKIDNINTYFESSLVTSESVYVIISLSILLILSLALLLVFLDRTRKVLSEYHRKKEKAPRHKEKSPRFSMLNQMDKQYAHYKEPYYERERNLSRICDDFRNFAASELGLYYDISDIRRIVAGFAVTRLIILQGMSGTGKTSLGYAFGKFIDNDSVIIPVQPMWKERSDIIGYFNEFTKRFNETTFLRKIYEANYKKEMYVTVLDEVNISRIEYYFAEFLSLLELPDEDARYLDVVSDVWHNDPKKLVNGKIQLPPNMWFIGTANNDDSTFAISDKVYDRAMILNLDKKCRPFKAPETKAEKISYARFTELVSEAKRRYSLSQKQEQNIRKLDEYLIARFQISFGNRIMKQIYEYVPVYIACGGSEIDALDDIFSKKVLRKLEAQSPSYVRNEVPALVKQIEDIFGKDSMQECKALLKRYEITV